MRIQKITSEYRNDFRAIMECEHCGATQELTTGYHDNHYHVNVIPAMCCHTCGKNRSGEVTGREDWEHVPAPDPKG